MKIDKITIIKHADGSISRLVQIYNDAYGWLDLKITAKQAKEIIRHGNWIKDKISDWKTEYHEFIDDVRKGRITAGHYKG